MNVKDFHTDSREVSAKPIAKNLKSNATAIQILKNGLLKEHVTRSAAVLICVLGEVIYEDEGGNKVQLKPGDLYEIAPMVKHWVKGVIDSQLILIR